MIRISVPFTNLYQRIASCLLQDRCLCSENVTIRFKTGIEAYFVETTVLGYRSCSRLANYAITFEQNVFIKIASFFNRSRIAMNLLVSLFCDVRWQIRANTHKPSTITLTAHARRGLIIVLLCSTAVGVYIAYLGWNTSNRHRSLNFVATDKEWERKCTRSTQQNR